MKIKNEIFIPGGHRQYELLSQNYEPNNKTILIIGSGSEEIAAFFAKEAEESKIYLIVDDNDSLLNSRIKLSEYKHVSVRMMDYQNTDFKDAFFDLVYSQCSISSIYRNKIVKEIKRILKPEGIFCAGEIVSLTKEIPQFIKDVWDRSELAPLFIEELESYYLNYGFKIIKDKDLSYSLNNFYTVCEFLSLSRSAKLTDDELRFYKKIINKISHEANVYLKQGGDKHIGFYAALLQKGIE